jgi:hypothetical protein
MLVKDLISFGTIHPEDHIVGIEVEVEADRLPTSDLPPGWVVTQDGSLRDGLEYIFRRPCTLKTAQKRLINLNDLFRTLDSGIRDSVRAGVHVHLNVQNMTLAQLLNFITISIMFEGVLARYCGRSREGNLFCLRSSDAQYILHAISEAAQHADLQIFNDDDLRYAFVNLKAIPTHGSLEFRSLKTPEDMTNIYEWVEILNKLRDAALRFECPADIIGGYSGGTEMDFFHEVMEDKADLLLFEDTEKLMYEGVRQAQDIAFADSKNWESLRNVIEHNPFIKAKVAKDGSPMPYRSRKKSRHALASETKQKKYVSKSHIGAKYDKDHKKKKSDLTRAYREALAMGSLHTRTTATIDDLWDTGTTL